MPPRSTKLASGSMLPASICSTSANSSRRPITLGPSVFDSRASSRTDLVVGLARREHRQLRDRDGLHGADRDTCSGGGHALDLAFVVTGGRHRKAVVDVGAERRHTVVTHGRLDALEVDPQPVHLDETAAAPDQFVQPIGVAPGDVAGMQRVDGVAERQVVGPVRIAHHHVGAAVHQLADVFVVPPVARFDRERSAGYRPADRSRMRRARVAVEDRPFGRWPPSPRTSRTGPSPVAGPVRRIVAHARVASGRRLG